MKAILYWGRPLLPSSSTRFFSILSLHSFRTSCISFFCIFTTSQTNLHVPSLRSLLYT